MGDEPALTATGAPLFARASSVVAREIAGETFLVPVKGRLADLQRVFVLNRVGGFVWECLDEGRTAEEVALAVMGRFEVEVGIARADVERFLGELRAAGLVEGPA